MSSFKGEGENINLTKTNLTKILQSYKKTFAKATQGVPMPSSFDMFLLLIVHPYFYTFQNYTTLAHLYCVKVLRLALHHKRFVM